MTGRTAPKDYKIDPTFNDALKEVLSNKSITREQRKQKFLNWRQTLPNNTVYQPNGDADHFSPLLSLVAAANYEPADFFEDYTNFGCQVTDFVWKY
jgi:hypothetical protein